MRIVTAYYKTQPLTVVLIIQDDNGKCIVTNIEGESPYFYQEVTHPLNIMCLDTSQINAMNGTFLKYEVSRPEQIPIVRNQYSYEADVPYTKRVIYDSNMDLGKNLLNKCYIDTEAYNPSSRFTDFAIDELKSVSIITHTNEKYVIFNARNSSPSTTMMMEDATYIIVPTEFDLLTKFYDITQDESMFIGWNLKEFDYMFIKIRSVSHNKYYYNRHIWMDLMGLYKRFVTSYSKTNIVTSFSLENVSQSELGIGKLDKSVLFNNENIIELMKYNLRDSELVKMIDEKTKLTTLIDSISTTTNILVEDCVHFSNIIEYSVMRELKGKYIFRTKTHQYNTTTQQKYEGAYVQEAPTGIFKNVATFDFESLYPNIIKTFNIGPDTINDNGNISIPNLPYHYTNTHTSVYNKLITNLLELRSKYKKMYSTTHDEIYNTMQIGVKFLIASFYGVLGFENGRLYDKRIAESITYTGKYFIKIIGNKFNSIYGDTDSVMVVMNDTSKENIQLVEKNMNKLIKHHLHQHNPFTSTMNITFEKLFSKVYFYGKKKRYYGIVCMDEKFNQVNVVFARGLEIRRTDWCPAAIEYETNILKLLLEDIPEAKKYHDEFIQNIRSMKNTKFVIHKSLTKPISEYKVKPPHLRVATQNDYIGSKIPYIITNYSHKKITSVSRNTDDCVPSYRYYIEKQIIPIYERLLKPLIGVQIKLM